MSRGPVYVAGPERSGTSLMFALLASHPSIAMTRRTNLWRYFYNQYGDLADPANLDRCLEMMMRYKRLRKLDPDRERLAHEFRSGEPTYARLFGLLEQHHAERIGKPRWGDKSLNTERYADAIFEGYPDARIVHMMRDPRDRYASVQTRWKSRLGGTGAGLAEWMSSAALATHNAERYPERYMVVRYETLASEPESTMARICAFIDEPYDEVMFSMNGAADFRDGGSNSSYGARAPGVISTDSIGRFRTVLSPTQIAFIQTVAGRQLDRFDYACDPIELAGSDRARYALVDLPIEVIRLVGWRLRYEWRNRRGRPLPAYRLLPLETPASTVDPARG